MNYIIEDNVNFFDQINGDIDDDCSDGQDKCLITYEPLLSDFVKMECGHKFNYVPLFNDVLNHKMKYNALEKSLGKLKYNEIRCPYCRNKQTTMLPYYEDKGFERVNGVNFLGATKCYGGVLCAHKHVNLDFNSMLPESDQNAKMVQCTSTFTYKIFANKYNDNNYYCYYHTKIVSKMYKAKAKAEATQLLKAAKELAIQQAKAEKEAAKATAKAEKEAAKAAAKAEKELAKAVKNTDKAVKNTDKATAKAVKNTDKAVKNTDKAIKNAEKELAKVIKNTDKAIKKADNLIKQTDKLLITPYKATTVKELMNVVLCSHVFIRGKNIGTCCGVKVLTGPNDTLCKKHSPKTPIV
jgi:hypothetical protein